MKEKQRKFVHVYEITCHASENDIHKIYKVNAIINQSVIMLRIKMLNDA